MDSRALLARLRSGRENWVNLDEDDKGRRVKILRPERVDLFSMMNREEGDRVTYSVMLDDVIRFTVDWDNFTEATFLGSALAPPDKVPFDRDLWAAYIRDDLSVVFKVQNALLKVIQDYWKAQEATAKNSVTGSTPSQAGTTSSETNQAAAESPPTSAPTA